jgi:CheY-like chemotaxis protein
MKANMNTTNKQLVLCIDDDEDDRFFVQEAIQTLNPEIEVKAAETGLQGLHLLEEAKQQGTLPCLIILDINMPGLNGQETFSQIKKDEQLANIPVVIFTTSSSRLDKEYWSSKGIEMFTKPIDARLFTRHVGDFIRYCA